MGRDTASIDLLSELDNVSKIHTLERSSIDEIMLIMAKKIVATLRIERMSVWLLNEAKDGLVSIGEYDLRDDSFKKDNVLRKNDFLPYFNAIQENKILYAENVLKDPQTICLSEKYSIPNNVVTLLDIPLRLEGNLIGVMCYEKTGDKIKEFTFEEKSFAFSVSVIFVSNLEARYRRAAQNELLKTLEEKELLIREMNHRIKNNFSILLSLLRISKENGSSKKPNDILEEYEQRIFSMLKIHDLLIGAEQYKTVNIGWYINELTKEYCASHPELSGRIISDIENITVEKGSREGLYIGLIITEIFLNAVKHVFEKSNEFTFHVSLKRRSNETVVLEIKDSGPGFNFNDEKKKSTLGLSLIKDLVEELDYAVQFPSPGNSMYRLILPE
ncbi:MAG: ATP-binding protein [Crocinitomicaceae bacterium]|nr:ATP-binding protein [Crocinitomicaceae bacterium]